MNVKKLFLVAVVVAAAVLSWGCQPDGAITILNTQTITGPDERPTPTPVPTTASLGGPVAKLSVGFFGRTCPGLAPSAPNDLQVGCTGRITCTPKDAAGNKLDPKDHGTAIRWFYEYGNGVLRTTTDGDNDFNRDASAIAPGDFKLCAEVRSVVGCVEGVVLP